MSDVRKRYTNFLSLSLRDGIPTRTLSPENIKEKVG